MSRKKVNSRVSRVGLLEPRVAGERNPLRNLKVTQFPLSNRCVYISSLWRTNLHFFHSAFFKHASHPQTSPQLRILVVAHYSWQSWLADGQCAKYKGVLCARCRYCAERYTSQNNTASPNDAPNRYTYADMLRAIQLLEEDRLRKQEVQKTLLYSNFRSSCSCS